MTPRHEASILERIVLLAPVQRLTRTGFGRRLADSAVLAPVRRRLRARERARSLELAIDRAARREAASLPTGRSSSADFGLEPAPTIATRFVILSEGRSGSTLLVHELGRRWPEIRSQGEMFNRVNRDGRSYEEIIEETYFDESGQSIVGCKVLVGQLAPEPLRRLLDLDDMRVIILRRRNILRRYVSEIIARQTHQWEVSRSHTSAPIDERVITVNTTDLHTRIVRTLAFWRYCDDLAARTDSIEVWYEDLSADLDGELRRIGAFLGAGEPASELPPRLTKQNPEPLEDLVANMAEVADFLRSNDLGHLLDEDSVPGADRTAPTSTEWLSGAQAGLLRLALGPEEDVEAEWRGWCDRPLDPRGGLDILAPAIHRRIRRLDRESAGAIDLRQRHASASSLRLRLLDRLAEILATFDGAEIPTMALDATALHVANAGIDNFPPLSAIVLMVPDARLDDAWNLTTGCGWRPTDPRRLAPGLSGGSPWVDIRVAEDDLRLRFRRRVLPVSERSPIHLEVWERAMVRSFADRTVRTPETTDQLLCTLTRGVHDRHQPELRWITEAHALITLHGDELDWSTLLERSERYGLDESTGLGLGILSRTFPGLVPDHVRDAVGVRR